MVLYLFPLSPHHFNKTAAYGSYMVLQLCTKVGAASSTKCGAVGHFMRADWAACRQMKSLTAKFWLPCAQQGHQLSPSFLPCYFLRN